MSNSQEKRITLGISNAAHNRLRQLTQKFDVTQTEILNITLERMTPEALEVPVKAYKAKMEAEAERARQTREAAEKLVVNLSSEQMNKIANLSAADIARLLGS